MCFEWRSANHQKWWATGVGTVLVAMAIVSTSFFRRWSSTEMHRSFDLIPGSESYNSWLQTTTPIYLSFYMFNWTNPNDIRNHSIKPKFVELGPYVYLEKHFKENLTYHDNGTVTYYERRTWHFDAVRSNGTENDMITTAHAITATVADEMRYQNQSVKKAINFMLNHEGGMLYTTKSVVEWVFKGFQDDLIDFLKHFNSTKINIPYKKFAWLADRNNSLEYDGAFTVHTGVVDISNVGLLTQWNRRNVTGFYPVPCGTVNGTMGDIFPPSMNTNEEVTVFVTDICRYMNLKPNGAIEHNGLTATEWVGTEETLDSGENYPNQQCFCDSKNEQCPKTGVVACKKCRYNAPIYASFPNFYLGDESYRSAVDGIKPDAAKHQFRLAVEPVTGIPVRVDGRVQMNMMITEDKDFDIYRGVQTFLMPLFWFDQSFALTQECATKAKQLANTIIANQYLHVAAYVFDSLFIIGIVVVVAENWYRTANADDSDDSDDDENMLTNDDESI